MRRDPADPMLKEPKTMSKLLLVSALSVALAGMAIAQSSSTELKVGDLAPDFSLPGTDGKTHKLSEYRGKAVVVAWYPAAMTPGCTAECKSFHANGPAIKAYDVAYFMASVDTPERNLEFAKVTEADFPLLSDPAKATATAYGVLNARGNANRWTFYVGPDGRITHIDKQVNAQRAAEDVLVKLAQLNVRKK
jgi:peroxiredoxin Q/BCP